jgi:hypothetical protein
MQALSKGPPEPEQVTRPKLESLPLLELVRLLASSAVWVWVWVALRV